MQIKLALFAAKNWKELMFSLIFLFILIFMLFFGVQPEEQDYTGDGTGGNAQVSPLVLRYQPLVEKYAQKYGIPTYVQLLLAFMMQESGGRLPDVMQSSESLGFVPNTIQDPEQSIDVGVRYFASNLKAAGGNMKTALQAYNFGAGFIPYAKAHGGYSKEVAVAFSTMMAKKQGWDGYGDVNYVDNVLRYYTGASYAGDIPINSLGFSLPLGKEMPITSPFGVRIDPITGIATSHDGVDFSCNHEAIPVYAAKAGTVRIAAWNNPNDHTAGLGQRIYMEVGGGMEIIYGHLSELLVKPGQKIEQKQMIGKCGSTGRSTGMHLHFEVHMNGAKVNPMQFIGG